MSTAPVATSEAVAAPPATTAATPPPQDNPKPSVGSPKLDNPVAPASGESKTVGWPALFPNHPLAQFLKLLPQILIKADYSEVWGVHLVAPPQEFMKHVCDITKLFDIIPSHLLLGIPQMNVLQKFLRANKNDINEAAKQLLNTLKWRKEFKPSNAAFGGEKFDENLFGGLGYITEFVVDGKMQTVVWNIYGAVTDKTATFGNLDNFMRWRVGLMEASIAPFNLPEAKLIIPDYDPSHPTVDPYQAIQVHDYLNISFIRQDPSVKAASKEIIRVMSSYYPELMSKKFFVNIPIFMQWVFSTVRLLVPKTTFDKFSLISYGETLHKELGSECPKEYGGKGGLLKEWADADFTLNGRSLGGDPPAGGSLIQLDPKPKELGPDGKSNPEQQDSDGAPAPQEATAKQG